MSELAFQTNAQCLLSSKKSLGNLEESKATATVENYLNF